MRKISQVLIIAIALMSLYGCNTIKGLGEDFTAVGTWIKNGSEKAKDIVADDTKEEPGS
ncbi:MAG: hypothetical protein KAJ18_02330 [Candidatus Omnitrophica bacterium]|nr:hypothetical protein [Candidatus Omnitrophota bacterium]